MGSNLAASCNIKIVKAAKNQPIKRTCSSIMQPVIATGSRFFAGILCGQRIKYTSSRSSKIMAALLCCVAKVDADRFSVDGESSVI